MSGATRWNATLLSREDNVATLLRPVAAGETVRVQMPSGIEELVALESIPLCHKVACRDIAVGENVYKYGACIGTARTAIGRGAWVHIHNLVSRRAQPAARK